MGAELARKRAGKATETKMSERQLADFARSPKKKLPKRGSGLLTPIGQRTLAGFQQKWGDDEGHQKFEAAVAAGTLSRSTMFKSPGNRHDDGKFRTKN